MSDDIRETALYAMALAMKRRDEIEALKKELYAANVIISDLLNRLEKYEELE